jgi:predicted NAD-dependent protein-ADP-ribosyltransferase YbiA (DUF1768 family)
MAYWKHKPFESADHFTSLAQESYENWTRFQSIGHYVQAAKAVLVGDFTAFHQIMESKKQSEHVQLGYNIKGFNQVRWDKCRPLILGAAILSQRGVKHESWKQTVFT